jgi:hypothetical protein
MRGLPSFLGLCAILAALGGYLYFVESRREPGSDSDRDKAFAVEAETIDEITVKAESGERTTLRKTGSDWQIVQPATLEPDSAEPSGIATNIANLEVQRVIDENPSDLKEYGLATPRIEITFKSGGQERRLLIGRKTPPGTDLYAKLGDQSRVFLISSYLDTTFNRTTFDLRDKTVMKLDRDKIDALTVATPSRTLKFNKPAGEWRLSVPVDARADFTAVDGLVSRLNTLQMQSIAAPTTAGLGEYGLDKPAATIQIGSGSSQATLLVGKAAGEGAVYAKDQSRPAVLTIDASLLEDLKKDADAYRQKDLFDARSFNATGLELTRKGQTFTFEKAKVKNKDGQDEEKWRQVAPAAQDIEPSKLDRLLSAVTQARASSFVASPPKALDPSELSVTVRSGEGRQETVRFGPSGTDTFAFRAGEPGAVKIDAAILDNIVKAFEELLMKPK